MVTANAERMAGMAQETLGEYDVTSLAAIAGGSALGVVASQTITDTVMGLLGMNRNPESIVEYATSIGVKGIVAVALGFAAAQLSGLAMLAAAFMGVGALASAGVDMVDGMLSTAPLGGDAPATSGAVGRTASQVVSAGKTSAKPATAGGDVSFR